jgi:hypothetical protein
MPLNCHGCADHPPLLLFGEFDIVEPSLDLLALLVQLCGLLRPGGLLVLTTLDSRHVLRFLLSRRLPMLKPLEHTFLLS